MDEEWEWIPIKGIKKQKLTKSVDVYFRQTPLALWSHIHLIWVMNFKTFPRIFWLRWVHVQDECQIPNVL